MKSYLTILSLLLLSWTAVAGPIPVRWLEGAKGYEKALELQKETKQPILVWTTWNTCSYCGQVTEYMTQPKPKKALQDYIRVVIDERGKPEDVACAKAHAFTGGRFFIVGPSSPEAKSDLWAWQEGGRVILPDLENTLASMLASAKE